MLQSIFTEVQLQRVRGRKGTQGKIMGLCGRFSEGKVQNLCETHIFIQGFGFSVFFFWKYLLRLTKMLICSHCFVKKKQYLQPVSEKVVCSARWLWVTSLISTALILVSVYTEAK